MCTTGQARRGRHDGASTTGQARRGRHDGASTSARKKDKTVSEPFDLGGEDHPSRRGQKQPLVQERPSPCRLPPPGTHTQHHHPSCLHELGALTLSGGRAFTASRRPMDELPPSASTPPQQIKVPVGSAAETPPPPPRRRGWVVECTRFVCGCRCTPSCAAVGGMTASCPSSSSAGSCGAGGHLTNVHGMYTRNIHA